MADRRGSAAVEFALVAPLLIAMLFGIICYGGYFWLSHCVQQAANDGARAAIAGLDLAERASLARSSIDETLPQYPVLDPTLAAVTVDEDAQRLKVTLTYDASQSPFWIMQKVIPMPKSQIKGTAVVRLGGY